MSKGKILLVVGIGLAVAAFFAFDLGRFFDLAFIKAQQSSIEAYRVDHPLLTAALFFVIYVAVTGLSLPGAAIMTLVAG
ncbi:MAG: pyridine nucleotide-disulfide oxidoreductase, partial [Sedimenticolaceae bacterium]